MIPKSGSRFVLKSLPIAPVPVPPRRDGMIVGCLPMAEPRNKNPAGLLRRGLVLRWARLRLEVLDVVARRILLQLRLAPWQDLLEDIRIEQQVRVDLQPRLPADRGAVRILSGCSDRAAPLYDRLALAVDHPR